MSRKYYPIVGQVFKKIENLEDRLEDSGWEWIGHGTDVETNVKDVQVDDRKTDRTLSIFLRPVKNGFKVIEIVRYQTSDPKWGK